MSSKHSAGRKFARELVSLAETYASQGNVSMHSLVWATGYGELRAAIEVEDILQALAERPERADQWISYSADKRTSGGWYFRPCAREEFEVGYVSAKGDVCASVYEDKLNACAHFVLLELDEVASVPR